MEQCVLRGQSPGSVQVGSVAQVPSSVQYSSILHCQNVVHGFVRPSSAQVPSSRHVSPVPQSLSVKHLEEISSPEESRVVSLSQFDVASRGLV